MLSKEIANFDSSTHTNVPLKRSGFIEIEQKSLRLLTEQICHSSQCRYPLLALRLLIHIITEIDGSGRVYISARHLSKRLDVNYDTITKCLKYLRKIEVLKIEK